MDWKTSLDWYCSGNSLDKDDLQILMNQYQQVIEKQNSEDLCEVAPKHICNQTKIPEGSTWIAAVAVVLDRLRPMKVGKTRQLIVDHLRRNECC
tara:strand:- start:970 stop:1251 length:282 start_codon:yes stop_codon:yes gene_type:complete